MLTCPKNCDATDPVILAAAIAAAIKVHEERCEAQPCES